MPTTSPPRKNFFISRSEYFDPTSRTCACAFIPEGICVAVEIRSADWSSLNAFGRAGSYNSCATTAASSTASRYIAINLHQANRLAIEWLIGVFAENQFWHKIKMDTVDRLRHCKGTSQHQSQVHRNREILRP